VDEEDRKQFQEFLQDAEKIRKELQEKDIACTRGEVLTYVLWRRENPKVGQIYPRR